MQFLYCPDSGVSAHHICTPLLSVSFLQDLPRRVVAYVHLCTKRRAESPIPYLKIGAVSNMRTECSLSKYGILTHSIRPIFESADTLI